MYGRLIRTLVCGLALVLLLIYLCVTLIGCTLLAKYKVNRKFLAKKLIRIYTHTHTHVSQSNHDLYALKGRIW